MDQSPLPTKPIFGFLNPSKKGSATIPTPKSFAFADAEDDALAFGGRAVNPRKSQPINTLLSEQDDERFADVSTTYSQSRQTSFNDVTESKDGDVSTPKNDQCKPTHVARLDHIARMESGDSLSSQQAEVTLFSPLSPQLLGITTPSKERNEKTEPEVSGSSTAKKSIEEQGQINMSPQTNSPSSQSCRLRGSAEGNANAGARIKSDGLSRSKSVSQSKGRNLKRKFLTEVNTILSATYQACYSVEQRLVAAVLSVYARATSAGLAASILMLTYLKFVCFLPLETARQLRHRWSNRTAVVGETVEHEGKTNEDLNLSEVEMCDTSSNQEAASEDIPHTIAEGINEQDTMEAQETTLHSRNDDIEEVESSDAERNIVMTKSPQEPTIEEVEKLAGVHLVAEMETDNSPQQVCSSEHAQLAPTPPLRLYENEDTGIDTSGMKVQHRNSEIIMSPLKLNAAQFYTDSSDEGVRDEEQHDANRERKNANTTHIQQGERQTKTFEGKRRLASKTSGLRAFSDIKGVKGSIKRALTRSKTEPETKFTSPRSAQKTLTLIADILVREYDCMVAVRKSAALKLRCARTTPSGLQLRIRVAFQELDAFSCNVVLSRAKEDEMLVSKYEYVNFVADLQRSFFDITSPTRR